MKKMITMLALFCAAAFAQQGTLTDFRDGKKYKTVKIGSQNWMAENLNYKGDGSKCYNEGAEKDSVAQKNCEKYGRLYNWEAAIRSCPDGWHLPSYNEWDKLAKCSDCEDSFLKSKAGWNNSGNGKDRHGFAAMPGGYGYSVGSFYGAGIGGHWWSASEDNALNAYYRSMYYYDGYAKWNYISKTSLQSVRCLQN